MAFAVRDQRQVQFHDGQGNQIAGYVMGADDFHWVVADRDDLGAVHLVHKSVPYVTILPLAFSLQEEAQEVKEALEPLLVGFQRFVMQEHFSNPS